MRLFYVMMFVPLWRYSVFPHYPMNGTIFGGGKIIEHKTCVFIFTSFVCLEHFLLSEEMSDILPQKNICYHVKLFLSCFNES